MIRKLSKNREGVDQLVFELKCSHIVPLQEVVEAV